MISVYVNYKNFNYNRDCMFFSFFIFTLSVLSKSSLLSQSLTHLNAFMFFFITIIEKQQQQQKLQILTTLITTNGFKIKIKY